MAITTDRPETAFWQEAPALLELASSIGEELSRSQVSPEISTQLKRLADRIPEAPEALSDTDPYLRSALLTGVIHSLRAADEGNRRELVITVERVRQALRDMLDEAPVWRPGPKDAAIWLKNQNLTVADLTTLLAASETSVRRWCSPDDETAPSGDHADRVIVVAKIVNHLRHAMTARGVVQWLERPHPALDDRKPIEELKDPDSYRKLIHLASGARSFVAT